MRDHTTTIDELELDLDTHLADHQPSGPVDDDRAERILRAIAARRRVINDARMLAELQRQRVDEWLADIEHRNTTTDLELALRGYAATKRDRTVRLPSGTLESRKRQPAWIFSGDTFSVWALDHYPDLLRTTFSTTVDKAAVKAALTIVDGIVVDPATGEAVPGVEVVDQDDSFTVRTESTGAF